MTDERRSFADALVRLSPPWLQRLRGAPFLRGLGDILDTLRDATAEAIALRLPRATVPTALGRIGQDRKILRGYNESNVGYAARLPEWLFAHQRRGGPYAMLRQIEGFWSEVPRRVDLIYANGVRYVLETDGTITRDVIATNADLNYWGRITVVYYETDPNISYGKAQALLAIPRTWSAAHIGEINVYVIVGDCTLWGYPTPVALWGGTELWGCAIDVNELYPGGPPVGEALTIDGAAITINGSELSII